MSDIDAFRIMLSYCTPEQIMTAIYGETGTFTGSRFCDHSRPAKQFGRTTEATK